MAEIGTTLREARMRRKIDINEVEAATKIRAKYLRALENEEWDILPGPTYVKSFLRTYGEYLGLDVTLLIEEFKRRHEHPSDLDQLPITPPLDARRKPPRPPRFPRGVIAGVVIATILIGLLVLGQVTKNDDNPPAAPEATQKTRAQLAQERRARRRAKARARRRARAAAARRQVRLKLVPTGVVFACVVDARDNAVVNGLNLQPGQPTETFRSKRFRLTVGNGALTLQVNGKNIDVPDLATSVAYEVKAGKARQLPEGTGPTCQ
jgi:cytoskeletal protein RodZ